MSSVVLGAETPVNIWKDWLFFIVYCAKDAAAYSWSLLAVNRKVVNKGVYTLLVQISAKTMGFLTLISFNGMVSVEERFCVVFCFLLLLGGCYAQQLPADCCVCCFLLSESGLGCRLVVQIVTSS